RSCSDNCPISDLVNSIPIVFLAMERCVPARGGDGPAAIIFRGYGPAAIIFRHRHLDLSAVAIITVNSIPPSSLIAVTFPRPADRGLSLISSAQYDGVISIYAHSIGWRYWHPWRGNQ